jgi:hypothetical protein
MVDRALSDFAEAVLGHNREMTWSLSEEIMMRSVKPVFDRLYEGKLTAEQALTVATDYVAPRIENNIEICQRLFTDLDRRLEELLNGETLPAQTKLKELFLGLDEEFNWTTDPRYMRLEFRPTFQRVESGEVAPKQAVMLFVDGLTVRNEAMLSVIKRLVGQLSEELYASLKRKHDAQSKAVNGND